MNTYTYIKHVILFTLQSLAEGDGIVHHILEGLGGHAMEVARQAEEDTVEVSTESKQKVFVF